MRFRQGLSLASFGVRSLGILAVFVAGCSVAYDATLAANSSGPEGGAAGGAGMAGGAGAVVGGAAGASGQAGAGGLGGTAGGAGASGAGGSRAGAAGSGGGRACPGGSPDECDDGNSCTAKSCQAGICVSTPLLPGSSCDTDTDKCNGVGKCVGTACKIDAKTVVNAADDDVCTDDFCDPATGIVTHPPKVKPTDSTACTQVTCDPATGNKLTKDLANDGDACTFDECSLETGPVNSAKPTGDGNPCTVDSCDSQSGTIMHVQIEGCAACAADADCDDGDPCTKDVCNEKSCTWAVVADGTSCDFDGTVCNGAPVCNKGVCKGTSVPAVDDGNPCTVDTCNPASGVITHTPIPGCPP